MDEKVVDGRWAADPPPAKNNQKRQSAEKPEKRGITAGDQRIAGVFSTGSRYGSRNACERVKQQREIQMAGLEGLAYEE